MTVVSNLGLLRGREKKINDTNKYEEKSAPRKGNGIETSIETYYALQFYRLIRVMVSGIPDVHITSYMVVRAIYNLH